MRAPASATASSAMSSARAVLLHLVDATLDDPAEAYAIIRGEVEAYGAGLEDKPEIVALSKADAVPKDEMKKKARALKKVAGVAPLDRLGRKRRGRDRGAARARARGQDRCAAPSTKTPRRASAASQGGGHERRMDERQAPRGQDRLVAAGRYGVGHAPPSVARSARR